MFTVINITIIHDYLQIVPFFFLVVEVCNITDLYPIMSLTSAEVDQLAS